MTNKEKIKQLANKIGFESKMFADEFKFSSKEDLRYYLWLHELNRFIYNTTGESIILNNSISNNETVLINYIEILFDSAK